MQSTLIGEQPQDCDAHSQSARPVALTLAPREQISACLRKHWVPATRGTIIIEDTAPRYIDKRGFSAFDVHSVKWAFRTCNLIMIGPKLCRPSDLLPQHAGRKIVIVVTHPDRYASWLREALRWRDPYAPVVSWTPPEPEPDLFEIASAWGCVPE